MLQLRYLLTLTFVLAFVAQMRAVDGAYTYPVPQIVDHGAIDAQSIQHLLQQVEVIGKLVIENANTVRCLLRKYLSTCDSITLIYEILNDEVQKNKNFVKGEPTREDLINNSVESLQRFLKRLQDANSKCEGRVQYDCNSEHSVNSRYDSKIPQELRDLVDAAHEYGSLIVQLVETRHNSHILFVIGDIFEIEAKGLLDDDGTSVGSLVAQLRKVIPELKRNLS